VKYLTRPHASAVFDLPRKPSVSVRLLMMWRKIMYRSISLASESSGDFTIVLIFALLGLAFSLLAIESSNLIAEYMADFMLLF
jgi:hypothetical protein